MQGTHRLACIECHDTSLPLLSPDSVSYEPAIKQQPFVTSYIVLCLRIMTDTFSARNRSFFHGIPRNPSSTSLFLFFVPSFLYRQSDTLINPVFSVHANVDSSCVPPKLVDLAYRRRDGGKLAKATIALTVFVSLFVCFF